MSTINAMQINWLYKIGELFDEAHVPVDSDLDMENSVPDYFEGLISLLDETSSRTIGKFKKKATVREMMKMFT